MGSHGGLGGPQTHPFAVVPAAVERPAGADRRRRSDARGAARLDRRGTLSRGAPSGARDARADDPGRRGRDAAAPSAPNSASPSRSAASTSPCRCAARSPASRRISPAGTERHHELERFVHVPADRDRDVAAAQRDVLEAGAQQDVARRVGVGHRERARARTWARRTPPGAARSLRRSSAPGTASRCRSRRRQTTITRRPPGTSALRTLRIAATGFAKNIVPKREKARSKPSSPPGRPARRRRRSARSRRPPRCLAHRVLDEARRRVHADRLSAPGPRARRSAGWCRRSRSRCRARARPRCGGNRRSASSPCAPSPAVTVSRKRTKRS